MTNAPTKRVNPLDVARRFLAAYATGDGAAIFALCADDAETEYVPWGAEGRHSVRDAVPIWARYPAAFRGFSMPEMEAYEDAASRTAIIATLNRGVQRATVDGIADQGGEMACPHLFTIGLNEAGLIRCIRIWCDQVTLYRQLGFPSGFVARRAA